MGDKSEKYGECKKAKFVEKHLVFACLIFFFKPFGTRDPYTCRLRGAEFLIVLTNKFLLKKNALFNPNILPIELAKNFCFQNRGQKIKNPLILCGVELIQWSSVEIND